LDFMKDLHERETLLSVMGSDRGITIKFTGQATQ